ncbi:hypothetical protein HJG54_34400 [Leptolyngbya sp. NK1-12]|uniref:Uncharacterized protein n=1 Tax=Leptolyngbya sp. NK1-12 TaxID=2547451 RepID=A0AA96WZI4_9CYAN|nr:hypothetical protein [Leptolyngbya sp. NK1-12]WNZ26876.1 hypothetical protein HJG54_28515 [Leptolyngbya sp. NK1-12]WNZ27912.1 hypothetical protein HJG54_34400 [Leptolyngbya sp. NK1-12]
MEEADSFSLELKAPGNFFLKLIARGKVTVFVFGGVIVLVGGTVLWINYSQQPTFLPAEIHSQQ